MSHAEKCPVCGGSGKVVDDLGTCCATVTCHGCDGRGWVIVADYDEMTPYCSGVPIDGDIETTIETTDTGERYAFDHLYRPWLVTYSAGE